MKRERSAARVPLWAPAVFPLLFSSPPLSPWLMARSKNRARVTASGTLLRGVEYAPQPCTAWTFLPVPAVCSCTCTCLASVASLLDLFRPATLDLNGPYGGATARVQFALLIFPEERTETLLCYTNVHGAVPDWLCAEVARPRRKGIIDRLSILPLGVFLTGCKATLAACRQAPALLSSKSQKLKRL